MDVDVHEDEDTIIPRNCIQEICQYYLKIRAHRKAKLLKQNFQLTSSNKGLRKSLALKGGSRSNMSNNS